MGCAADGKVKSLTLSPDSLLVVDIQRRRGGQVLLTCAISEETTIAEVPIFRCQLGYTQVVKKVRDQRSVLVLIRPEPGMPVEIGQTLWFSQHSAPRFPVRNGRVLFVCHEGGAVLLRQMLRNADQQRLKCLQHAHEKNSFFCDAVPESVKLVGEEELVGTLNEELGGFDYVMAVGPLWLLQTTRMLSAYYARPAFGFYCVCCGSAQEDKPGESWFELETYAAEALINNQENEHDTFEAAYQRSDAHLRCLKAIEQAQNSLQTIDGTASINIPAKALDDLLHSIPKDTQAAPDFLNTLQKELELARFDQKPPVKPSSPKTAVASREHSGVALPASRFPASKATSKNVSTIEQPIMILPDTSKLPIHEIVDHPASDDKIVLPRQDAEAEVPEEGLLGNVIPRKRAKSSKRCVSARQQVLMSSLITKEETKELQALEAAGIDELSSIGDDKSDEILNI